MFGKFKRFTSPEEIADRLTLNAEGLSLLMTHFRGGNDGIEFKSYAHSAVNGFV